MDLRSSNPAFGVAWLFLKVPLIALGWVPKGPRADALALSYPDVSRPLVT
jgi:hypothetical protein